VFERAEEELMTDLINSRSQSGYPFKDTPLVNKFNEETLMNTLMNSSRDYSHIASQQQPKSLEKIPEVHFEKYYDYDNLPKVLLLYGESVIQFDILQQTVCQFSLKGLLGVSGPSNAQINENGELLANSSEIIISGGMRKDGMFNSISGRTQIFSTKTCNFIKYLTLNRQDI
jgi:hypothetical protein